MKLPPHGPLDHGHATIYLDVYPPPPPFNFLVWTGLLGLAFVVMVGLIVFVFKES